MGSFALPFGKIYACFLILGWLFSKERKLLSLDGSMTILLVLFIWTILTTITAKYSELSVTLLSEFAKISLLIFILTAILSSKFRIHAFIWIVALSIGYIVGFSGMRTVLAAGSATVSGLAGTIYNTENTLARGAILLIPLLMFLYFQSERRWARWGLLGAMGLAILCLIGTGSRGGFIGFAGMIGFIWLRSRRKIMLLAFGTVSGLILLSTVSGDRLDEWTGRMETIQTAEEQATANQRIEAWLFAIRVANESPIVGGGFGIFRDNIDARSGKALLAHNNFFQVLGEHGYVGLTLYCLLLLTTYFSAGRSFRRASRHPDMRYERDLAFALQTMLVGYAIGGLTITHSYYELFYVTIGLTRVLREQVDTKIAAKVADRPTSRFRSAYGPQIRPDPHSVAGPMAKPESGYHLRGAGDPPQQGGLGDTNRPVSRDGAASNPTRSS